jgi:hypothetical protein
MRKTIITAAGLAIAGLAIAGCGGSSTTSAPATRSASPATSSTAEAASGHSSLTGSNTPVSINPAGAAAVNNLLATWVPRALAADKAMKAEQNPAEVIATYTSFFQGFSKSLAFFSADYLTGTLATDTMAVSGDADVISVDPGLVTANLIPVADMHADVNTYNAALRTLTASAHSPGSDYSDLYVPAS